MTRFTYEIITVAGNNQLAQITYLPFGVIENVFTASGTYSDFYSSNSAYSFTIYTGGLPVELKINGVSQGTKTGGILIFNFNPSLITATVTPPTAAELAAIETARLAAIETARLEAIAETMRIEAARVETERLAAIEAARLATIETDRLAAIEAERLATVEAERIAAEQEALLIEAARVETERLAAIEAARLATIENDRLAAVEADRLAAIESARVEAARVEAERIAALEAESVVKVEIPDMSDKNVAELPRYRVTSPPETGYKTESVRALTIGQASSLRNRGWKVEQVARNVVSHNAIKIASQPITTRTLPRKSRRGFTDSHYSNPINYGTNKYDRRSNRQNRRMFA